VPWWRKALDAAQLKLPLTEEPKDVTLSAKAGILAFTDEHEEARSAVAFMHSIVTPASYVQAMYNSVHAFRLVNAEGVACYVRFTWEPVAGVSRQDDLDEAVMGPDLDLHDELPGRLAQWPAQFMLRAQLAELGDDVTDPTTPFKDTRPRLALGLLTIEAMAGEDGRGCEHLSFNPTRLVDGVECSGDEILEARRWAYAESCRQRGGEGCEVAAP
jgi:catalase